MKYFLKYDNKFNVSLIRYWPRKILEYMFTIESLVTPQIYSDGYYAKVFSNM